MILCVKVDHESAVDVASKPICDTLSKLNKVPFDLANIFLSIIRIQHTLLAEVQVLQYPPLHVQSTRQIHNHHW